MSDFCQLTGQERLFNPRIAINDREFTAGVDGFGDGTSQCRIQRREVDWRIDIPRLFGPGFGGGQLLIQQQIFGQFGVGSPLFEGTGDDHIGSRISEQAVQVFIADDDVCPVPSMNHITIRIVIGRSCLPRKRCVNAERDCCWIEGVSSERGTCDLELPGGRLACPLVATDIDESRSKAGRDPVDGVFEPGKSGRIARIEVEFCHKHIGTRRSERHECSAVTVRPLTGHRIKLHGHKMTGIQLACPRVRERRTVRTESFHDRNITVQQVPIARCRLVHRHTGIQLGSSQPGRVPVDRFNCEVGSRHDEVTMSNGKPKIAFAKSDRYAPIFTNVACQ